jgi:hypothetical protein
VSGSAPYRPTSAATLAGLREAFAAGGEVRLDLLEGLHAAEFVGPGWWRRSGPVITRLGGMPAWWGKRFWASPTQPQVLDGQNLLRRDGGLVPSFPMQARVAPSRFDGRPALVVSYPRPAPWTWRQVTDELRPLPGLPGTLVGLTATSAPVLTGGLPFLLHRAPDPQTSTR